MRYRCPRGWGMGKRGRSITNSRRGGGWFLFGWANSLSGSLKCHLLVFFLSPCNVT